MHVSRSPQRFLERSGLRPTLRSPIPRMRTDNPLHTYPLVWPLPHAHLSLAESGSTAPDRVVTQIWPHGRDHK